MRTLPSALSFRNLHPYALAVQPTAQTPAPALPEAPCSINAHVDINGLRLQITGRGTTPDQAAHNFKATLAAMQPQPAPEPVLQTREQQVAALLACWLGKAVARQDFGLVERLSKGAALVLAGMVEPSNTPGVFAVRSATSVETWYTVESRTCTCQDYVCHARKDQPEHACKHIVASAFFQRLT